MAWLIGRHLKIDTEGTGNPVTATDTAAQEPAHDTTLPGPAAHQAAGPAVWCHEMIQAALSSLMDANTAAGTIRSDISPTDMFAALAGIALTSAEPEQREQAERLLDLTLDGLKPAPSRLPEN